MANYALTDVQSHVQLMSRHDGLASLVLTWTNRVVQDICTRAYWMRNTGVGFASPFIATTTALADILSAQIPLATPNPNLDELINVVGMDHVALTGAGTTLKVNTFIGNLRRSELRDLYAAQAGAIPGSVKGPKSYAVIPRLGTNSNTTGTTDTDRGVAFLVFPPPPAATTTSTAGGALAATYLGSLPYLNDSSDTNWILARYFKVVLAGVMRYVRLYLGDSQGYLLERSEYENGIRDMLLHEEAATAGTPGLRAVGDEYMGRAQA